VTVSVTDENTLSSWEIQSDFPTEWSVNDFIFPIISLPKTDEQKLIVPAGWGAEYELKNITRQKFSHNYPGSRGTVQLMTLHENNDVFYFATHDPQANKKLFSAGVSGSDIEFSNSADMSAAWDKEGKFRLPYAVSIGLSNKGWEDAVRKWYKPFALETV